MSLVTLGDKAKVLQMVTGRAGTRDRLLLLLSLSMKLTWTDAQRKLVERVWTERQRPRADSRLPMADSLNKEADMKTKTVLCVGIAMTFALMAGCASTYTKITEGPNGKAVEELTYEPKWWANLDRPDWMDVVERQSYVPGQAPVHETCDVEPTQPTVLRCLRK